jgi:glycosyltransferase involved in cell wall biosynthesis
MKHISVIIPVFNGEEIIGKSIDTVGSVFNKLGYKYEIIVVNDGSTDDTNLVISMIELLNKNVISYSKPTNQGKGSAIMTGLKIASKNSEYVIVMDADLQIQPSEITTFFKIMDLYDADVVIGNKRHSYSNTNYSLLRGIISNGYYFMVWILFQLPLKDTQCGFKLFKKDALNKVMQKLKTKQYAFDLEVLIAMRDRDIRVSDAPVKVRKQTGKGSVNIMTILKTFKDTITIFIRRMTGWYR